MNNAQKSSGLTDTFVELFNKSTSKVTSGLSSATLAKVTSTSVAWNGVYGVYECQMIPQLDKNGTQRVDGWAFSKDVTEGSIVLLVFTDKDFRDSVKVDGVQSARTYSTGAHSKNFGVIVKL